MAFCLPKFAADSLKSKFKSGELNPENLSSMSSAERRQAFSFLGEENARQVNASFETKLLLKNQQKAMINWAEQILRLKPEVLKDTLSKVEKSAELLSPKQLDSFLEDLVAKKLGVEVSFEEAGKLVDLAKSVESAKSKVDRNSPNNSPSRLEYGLEFARFKSYVEDLKLQDKSIPIKDYFKFKNIGKTTLELASISKSILSTLDNSFFGRQGIKVLFTNPDIWVKNFTKSWGDIAKELRGLDAVEPIKADIFSRENALNGKYKAGEYALGLLTEEAFPSSLPSRIPILGRLFKASESAYNGAALRMRADLADRVIKNAEKSGIDVTDPLQAKSLGKLVNSMTGRGSIGKLEVIGKEINAALFSVKFLKSNIDTLTANLFDKNITPYARKEAAKNLVKITASIAGIMAISEALWPDSVEWDPRSANFGKLKFGNTRFDITGGMAGLVTLASRMVTGETKSSITGKITDLNSGKYGALNRADVLYQFAEGKTSPALKAVIDRLNNKNFTGEKPTTQSTIKGLVTPLPIVTYQELRDDPNSANKFWAILASELGIGVNTYSKKNK